jgi:hypothetical protein
MVAHAEELGADAIVNVRFITAEVTQGAAEILAYGTAVKLAPAADVAGEAIETTDADAPAESPA